MSRWSLLLVSLALPVLLSCTESAVPDSGFDTAAFADPPIGARPWVRWWWPGNDVDATAISADVKRLAGMGFGGAEIQAFDAGLNRNASADELARRRSVWSPTFYEHLRAALDAAREEGLAIDLTLGSGWATGGDHVAPEKSLLTLAFSETRVTGPGPAEIPLDGPDLTPFYKIAQPLDAGGDKLARWRPELAVPVTVLAAHVVGGERSTNWLTLDDQLQLDPASVTVVEAAPEVGQTVTWTVPEGDWVVLAFYAMPDGEYPNFNAQVEPGWVTDPFDTDAVAETLETLLGVGAGLASYEGSPLTGLFVDSFELKVERFFSRDFLEEFEARRGYDLTPWLPVVMVPGADNNLFDGGGLPAAAPFVFDDPSAGLGAGDERVRYDYQRTASELFVERFADTVRRWAEERGMGLRMQAYGLNVDVLAAFGATTVPEVEQLYAGGTDLFLKLGSSAAHLYGKPICSAESFVWPGKDGYETPALFKAAADKLFVAGVTRLVYHGFAAQPSQADAAELGSIGWHPFSNPYSGAGTYSSLLDLSPWGGLGPSAPYGSGGGLNGYVARVQSALRQGQPDADVLVLYPWLGFPASYTRLSGRDELLFNGRFNPDDVDPSSSGAMAAVTQVFGDPVLGARGEWIVALEPLLAELHAAGYAWDWVNEERLQAAVAEDGRVRIGDVTWDAVLLVDVPWLAPETAKHLADLAAADVRVAVVGTLPARQPGLADQEAGDATVVDSMATLMAGPRVTQVEPLALASTLEAELGVAPGVRFWPDAGGLRHVRRALPAGELIFFSNPARASVATAVELPAGCEAPTWLDPWTGAFFAAELDAEERVLLHLGGLDAALLHCGGGAVQVKARPTVWRTLPVTNWTVAQEGEPFVEASALPDLRDVSDLATTLAGVVYSASLDLPEGVEGATAELDLGWLDGSPVILRVGNTRILDLEEGLPSAPPFRVAVPAGAFQAGTNELSLFLGAPPFANWIRATNDPQAARYAERPLAPFGLRGPVTLTLFKAEAE